MLGDRAMNRRHFNCLVACLLLFISAGCTSDRGWQYAFEPYTAMVTCASWYYADRHCWPTSREELVEWVAKHNDLKFPNERYALVSFQEQKDRSVLIHYETTDKGEGIFLLGRPSVEIHRGLPNMEIGCKPSDRDLNP